MPTHLASLKFGRKRAELEHQRLTALINSMADGVIATDEQGEILLYNGAALNILDRNTPMDGKRIGTVLKLYNSQDDPIHTTSLVVQTKLQNISRDYKLRFEDGSETRLYLSIAPVRLGYGKNGESGFVLLLRDITREKSLEDERDEFISVVSHELRTPVTIAEGNLSNAAMIFDKGGDPEAIKTALHQAHEQVLFLAGLINDLSTLSRAENDKLEMTVKQFNVYQLLTEMADNYRPSAARKGLELHTDIDPSLELLTSSTLYVREIIQNFITNAVKYTETGSVTLGAKSADNGVIVTVSDTGIGISKADQEKVYHKFFRSEDYRTRQSKGTGLGLYVTRKLARLIHADISLRSRLNHGSTFSIYIPNLDIATATAQPSD